MVYFLIAAFVVAADQIVKYFVVKNIALGATVPVVDGVLHLTYVQNTGAAFSMLNEHTWVLTAISCVCVVLLSAALLMKSVPKIGKYPLSMILGGAIGNLIDRVRLGYVVDMFEPEFIEFAVFNVADIFITWAGVFFCIVYIVLIIKEEREKKLTAQGTMPEIARLKKQTADVAGDTAAAENETAAENDTAECDGGETVDERDNGEA